MPTKIIFENYSLNKMDELIKGRKTLLVTSEGFIKRGLVEKLNKLTNSLVNITSDIKSHPEFKDLKHSYNQAHSEDFELILAIGGGSVLDAAKFLSVYNSNKDADFVEDLIKGKAEAKDYKTIPIISVPTTAGTSSEITPWATIWDMDEKKKYSLHLPELFSEIALYDPSLTLSVPKDITIQTGLDALSHSLESIWNKNASDITISYAIRAAKLVVKNLAQLTEDLDNPELRSKLMQACMYAGMAFSNTQTAIAHAMSYYITAHKGTPHGIACSFTLPMLIDKVIGQYKEIDKALEEIFGELSSNKLRQLLKVLGVGVEFSDYGLSEHEVKELYQSLANVQRAGNSLISL